MANPLRNAWSKWVGLNNGIAKWAVPGLLIPFLITVPGANSLANPGMGPWEKIGSFWKGLANPEAWSAGFTAWGGALSSAFGTAVAAVPKVKGFLSTQFAAATAATGSTAIPIVGGIAIAGLTAVLAYKTVKGVDNVLGGAPAPAAA
jgi:hypothetical protein